MSPLLSTLPGDIPGLLRRGSPVMYGTRARVVEDVEDFRLGGLHLAQEQFATCWLDLSDATARAHVAAWLMRQEAAHIAIRKDAAARHVFVQARDFEPMTATEIDTLARFALRVAGRTP